MFPQINSRQSFPALEQEMLAYWKANNTFKKSLEIREWAPEFNFYDGPPFATGTPHYGHLLAGTIKDVIPRYQTMQGKFVERRFGWDCHGLPIENIVEKKLGISGKKDIEEKIGVYEFNEECRRNVLTYVDDWRQTVERMGRWVDMDNDYKTMDTDFMESVWWVFKNIYDKGYVYESYRVVPYCTRCSTPLSNFEVNQGYEDRQDKAVTVKFAPHLQKSAGLYIENDKGEVLLWHDKKGFWGCPGWKVELGESHEEWAMRELFEETGLSLKITPEDCRLEQYDVSNGCIYDNRIYKLQVWDISVGNGEPYKFHEWKFFPKNELPENLSDISRYAIETVDSGIRRKNYPLSILAWTTTPWTLPANLGLAVGENIIYAEVADHKTQETYILAKERIASYYKNPEDYEIVREFTGSNLVGVGYEPMFGDFVTLAEAGKLPKDVELGTNVYHVVPGHHVTTDSGTGVVHIAPAYGEDDFQIGKRENLGFISHIDAVGHTTGLLSDNDVYVFDYNQIVIDRLKSEKKLVHVGTIDHSYPHCYRCHTPLIYRAISAWYVSVESLKERMIANNEKITWMPETIKHGRFGKWVEGARDWNISRNRYWGSAIPVWKSEDGDVLVIGSVEELYQANRDFGDITKIVFIRHGESDNSKLHITDYEWTYDLNENGKRQADKLKEQLGNMRFDAVFSSPSLRCVSTVQAIANLSDQEVQKDERLREIQNNNQGLPYIDRPLDLSSGWNGGESFQETIDRVTDFLHETLEKNRGKTVLICWHGDTLPILKNEYEKLLGNSFPKSWEINELYFYTDTKKPVDLHKHFVDNIKLSKDGKTYTRIPEVLDCWFESGSMPYASKHYPFEFLSHGKTFDAIEQAVTYEEKEQCLRFFKTIWSDDLKKKYDMDAFFDSDIFFIREKWEIVSVAEVFKIDKESSLYEWRYDYESLKKIQNKNSVYISRLGTSEEHRNKWYATNLLEFVSDKYASEWLDALYLATAKEDFNAPYYEKLGFIKNPEEFPMGKYTFSNFEKKLSKIRETNFRFPADFIAEGLDQTRGWFYTLLILGTALFDNTPFMNVIVNGIILAEDGRKMSKSLKNYPDPNEILKKHGADALRFYLLSSPVVRADDLRFSEAGVEETVKKVILPLWNTYSFFTTYANIDGWSPSGTVVDYVRHGQTGLNMMSSSTSYEERTVSGGLNDHELTEEGRGQAKRTGERLRKSGTVYDVIVSTGMKRTDETARIIAQEIGFTGEWVTEAGLRERMVDEKHEGAKWEDIGREYEAKFGHAPKGYGIYLLAEMGVAESNEAFEERTRTAYEELLKKYAGKRILIVGHGNTFRSVYGYALGLSREEAFTQVNYRLGNAELAHFPAVRTDNPLDRFILGELQTLIAKVTDSLETYDLQRATRAIVDFMDDLTNWYVRRSRRRFWESGMSTEKTAAYETLYRVLADLTRVLAPFCPFVSESIYRSLTGKESVHLSLFPEFERTLVSRSLLSDMKKTKDLVTLGLAVRGREKIRVRQPLGRALIGETLDEYYLSILKDELNIKEITVADMSVIARKICKPNARLIGAKFGKAVQEIIREAKAGNFTELENGGVYIPPTPLTKGGSDEGAGGFTLEPGEFEIAYEPLEAVSGLAVEGGFGTVIAIDTTISEELKLEWYARDIVRSVQDLRKEAGYQVSDHIRLSISWDGTVEILSQFGEYIASETLSALDNSLTEGDISREVDIDGAKVIVTVKR